MDNEGFFVRTTSKADPPSGGGGGGSAAAAVAAGAQNIAINVPNTPSPIDMGTLTTSAPSAFTMNPATPSVSTQGIGEALAKGTGQGAKGTGFGTGNGTGTGPGTGSGTGGGNGTGTGTGNGSAEGTYLAGGNALPKGSRVLLIVDSSGSIKYRWKILSKVKNEIKKHDKANKTVEVESSFFSHIIPSIKAGIKSKYDVIIWITDLQDHADAEYHFFAKNYEEYTKIEELLQQAGVKFFITSFESEPTSWLTQIVKSSGGSFSIQRE